MSIADTKLEQWIAAQIKDEPNARRREWLKKGLGHGTIEFLKTIWLPAVGSLEHLYPEWEVRDLSNRYRYLDLVYTPNGVKGCIEIHGYRSHARDIEAWRFKDLCMKQALLALDDWLFLPIAYLSIKEEPEMCKQLALAFVGKFVAAPATTEVDWAGAEALRYARRLLRPFTASEFASHLQRSERQARRILEQLTHMNMLENIDDKQRYRTYKLTDTADNASNGQK